MRILTIVTLGLIPLLGACNQDETLAVGEIREVDPPAVRQSVQAAASTAARLGYIAQASTENAAQTGEHENCPHTATGERGACCDEHDATPAGGTAPIQEQLQLAWEQPKAWVTDTAHPMRYVTFKPDADSTAECYVTILSGAAGGEEANINRWRQQMGQGPLTATGLSNLEALTVLGNAARLVEIAGTYAGMSGAASQNFALLGVVCPLGNETVFIKMVGPREEIAAERDNFVKFCESLRVNQA